MHRPQSIVYKVDYLVLRTLLSSLILFNTRVCFLSSPQNLSHNIYRIWELE